MNDRRHISRLAGRTYPRRGTACRAAFANRAATTGRHYQRDIVKLSHSELLWCPRTSQLALHLLTAVSCGKPVVQPQILAFRQGLRRVITHLLMLLIFTTDNAQLALAPDERASIAVQLD